MDTKKRVLVVEDDALIRMELTRALTDAGFEPIAEESGEAGLEAFKREKPAACVFDIMLPKMSGLDLLEQIRAEHPHDTTPVYFLTSTNDMEYIARATESKAAGFINKANGAIESVVERLQKQLG